MNQADFRIARTPSPPYCAVIFTAQRAGDDAAAYEKTAARMRELAARREGFLGMESARDPDGFGMTISYWRDAECARAWKLDAEHLEAQRLGRERFYRAYRIRICAVEREYGGRGGE